MKHFILLWTFFFVPPIFAGITYEKNNKESIKQKSIMEKTADEIKKVVPISGLSDVNAHLIIEGASFRKFNLYLLPIETASKNQLHKKLTNDVGQIIVRDFNVVGGFNFITHSKTRAKGDEHALLKQMGAEGISKVTLKFQGDIIKATAEHKNLITGQMSFNNFSAPIKDLRRLSHLLAQNIYEAFIGPESLFLLQIAAIKTDAVGISQVVMLDFDGQNEIPITKGALSKALPYFAPDGKSILYTMTYPRGQRIVEQDISSNRIQIRTDKPGLNIEPRIFPDNSGMLVTLSFENNANIYWVSRTGSILRRMTSQLSLNLSPSISPDGQAFVFVSEMAGTPQIYFQKLTKDNQSKPERLTYQGKYNQTPHFSPDGRYIAFTGRDEKGVFDIFLLKLPDENSTSRITQISRITQNQGRNEGPHITPSSRFVIFVSEREGKRSDIFIASLDGKHQYRLTDANKSKSLGYYSPVVRPK